jgi:hypothetical protein
VIWAESDPLTPQRTLTTNKTPGGPGQGLLGGEGRKVGILSSCVLSHTLSVTHPFFLESLPRTQNPMLRNQPPGNQGGWWQFLSALVDRQKGRGRTDRREGTTELVTAPSSCFSNLWTLIPSSVGFTPWKFLCQWALFYILLPPLAWTIHSFKSIPTQWVDCFS